MLNSTRNFGRRTLFAILGVMCPTSSAFGFSAQLNLQSPPSLPAGSHVLWSASSLRQIPRTWEYSSGFAFVQLEASTQLSGIFHPIRINLTGFRWRMAVSKLRLPPSIP